MGGGAERWHDDKGEGEGEWAGGGLDTPPKIMTSFMNTVEQPLIKSSHNDYRSAGFYTSCSDLKWHKYRFIQTSAVTLTFTNAMNFLRKPPIKPLQEIESLKIGIHIGIEIKIEIGIMIYFFGFSNQASDVVLFFICIKVSFFYVFYCW